MSKALNQSVVNLGSEPGKGALLLVSRGPRTEQGAALLASRPVGSGRVGLVGRTGDAWEFPVPCSWAVFASFSLSLMPCTSKKWN